MWNICFNKALIAIVKSVTFLLQLRYDDDDDADGPAPDPALEYGMPLPIRLAAEFPPELVATPIEDIDTYYQNKKVPYFCYQTQYMYIHLYCLGLSLVYHP